jgi:hypothetical protein
MIYIINGLGLPGRILPALIADRLFGILNPYVVFGVFAGIAVLLDCRQDLCRNACLCCLLWINWRGCRELPYHLHSR